MEKDEKTTRLKKWFNGNHIGPYKLQLNPTNNCNLRCLSCYARGKAYYDPPKEVSTERYIELIKEAAKLNTIYCDICGGGEPFMRSKTTLAIMGEVKKQGMIGTLITNGTLFSEESIKELVNTGWDYVNLSIDGPNAGINDFLRGKGVFKKSIKAIRLFNFWKQKLKKNVPHVSIYTVISKKNYNYINEFIDLAIKLRIEGLYFQPIVVSQGRGQELIMDAEDWATFKKVIDTIKKRLSENEIQSNIEFIDQDIEKNSSKIKNTAKENTEKNQETLSKKNIICFSPWLMVAIRADGTAGPCPPGMEYIKNCNIKNETLEKVWYGEVFDDFRKKMIEQKKLSCCDDCGSMEIIANKSVLKEIIFEKKLKKVILQKSLKGQNED